MLKNLPKKYHFSIEEKVIFHISYFFYKFATLYEVKSPKWKMFANELYYSAGKIFKTLAKYKLPYPLNNVSTRFGIYTIRPQALDVIWASPAFERRDINYLLKLLTKLTKHNKRILFLDVGADFGAYAITVGNHFRNYPNLYIHAYEPFKESYELLKTNIVNNKLELKIVAHNFGLLDRNDHVTLYLNLNPNDPGSNSVREYVSLEKLSEVKIEVKCLDNTGLNYSDFDVIIFKIDVEGVESLVLKGAINCLKSRVEKYILVEDFVNTNIISNLENAGAVFDNKLTSYNSWWKILPINK